MASGSSPLLLDPAPPGSLVTLDLGTTSGVSTYDAGLVTSEEWRLAGSTRDELVPLVGDTKVLRPHRMFTRLGALLRTLTGPVFVLYELIPFQKTVLAAQVYAGLRDAAVIACAEQGVPILGVHPSTYRQAVLGKTNPTEADLMAHARMEYPQVVLEDTQHNAADSLVLLTYGLRLPVWGTQAVADSQALSAARKKPARRVFSPRPGQPF